MEEEQVEPVYGAETYGERVAPVYDAWYDGVKPGMIDVLASFAGGGPALELGIGSGRIALPLVQRGIEVHGIDASESMVALLRGKPGGERIPVRMDSFASVDGACEYGMVYVVFNTFFALLTQGDQVRCFAGAARALRPGGCFLMEAFVPDMTRFERGQCTNTTRVGLQEVMIDASLHDPVLQRVSSQHVVLSEAGVSLYPVEIRYAWPSELDLMARLAGLRLKHRWAGWGVEPFTAGSGQHISVWEKPLEDV